MRGLPNEAQALRLSQQQGDHSALAELLRSEWALSSKARRYVAELIEGKFKRKVGRPRNPLYGSELTRHVFQLLLEEQKREIREKGGSVYNIHEEAIEQLSAWVGIDFSVIQKILHPRRDRRGQNSE